MLTACRTIGRPMDLCHKYREWMEEIGFVDIEEKLFVWPTNTWPKVKHLKELGRWNEVNLSEGMEGFSLALMTRALGWSKDEVEVLCAKVRNDLRDRSIHAYFPMYDMHPSPSRIRSFTNSVLQSSDLRPTATVNPR